MISMVARMPMTQDVDAMWEADAAAEWERINAPDKYHNQMVGAAASLDIAVDKLDKAMDFIADALSEVDGTPMELTVRDLYDKLDDLKYTVSCLKDKYERGERE